MIEELFKSYATRIKNQAKTPDFILLVVWVVLQCNMETHFSATSLAAWLMSRREDFWTFKSAMILSYSGCEGVNASRGWLQTLRRYWRAYKGNNKRM